MATEAPKRVVPGAPPQASKASKKKRRGAKKDGDSDTENTPAASSIPLPDARAAALTEKAPGEKDVKSGSVAEGLVVHPEAPKSDAGDVAGAVKSSPVVDLLNKRLKNIGKKITRIQTYSSKPLSELNDDQKKTLQTLPSLEAVRKELEETKKAVETLEADEAREAALIRAAAEEAERQRVTEAVVTTQRVHAARLAQILELIRLQSLLTNADPSVQALNLVEAEINAIYASANALLAQEAESKQKIVHGFLLGEGEVEGVSVGRLLEILDAYMNPPIQEPVADTEDIAQAIAEAVAEAEAEIAEAEAEDIVNGQQPDIPGGPTAPGGLSLRFMQESELENEPLSVENGTEWVEREDNAQEPVETTVSVSVEIKETYARENGAEAENGAIDWADDEGELPSIDGLHASFGTSGPQQAATKTETQNTSAPEQAESNKVTEAAPNGSSQEPGADNDGFMQARGGRGRPRGRGFRDRGAFRGGGDRGYRGRGPRGRPNQAGDGNSWRVNADGEPRARGRWRGRGFDRERGTGNGARGRGGGNSSGAAANNEG